ncbi:MAG TPA: DUF58 domain-containing protein [Anaerolineaceae bacterium]
MIGRGWFPLLLMVILLGALFSLSWLVSVAAALVVLLYIAWLWNRHALDNVHYRRRWHYRRGFPGEKFDLRLEIENRKLLPVSWLRVCDAWPRAVGPEDTTVLAPTHVPDQGSLVNLYSLRWFQQAARGYSLLLRKRGYYPVGPIDLESGDMLGMFETQQRLEQQEYITVFPAPAPLKTLRLPANDPFGDRRSTRRRFEDPTNVMGVRDYHPEDDFRRVHWPATARTGTLQVKQYEHISAQVMLVCLNVATTEHHWLGTEPHILEHLVSVAATLVTQGFNDGYAVGLFSNGCLAHADQPFRILPGRSRNQPALLLQALAGVTSFTTGTFEWVLGKALPHLPYGATLVIVTAFVSPQLAEMLVRLRQHRPHITLLTYQVDDLPQIPGMRVLQLPPAPLEPA